MDSASESGSSGAMKRPSSGGTNGNQVSLLTQIRWSITALVSWWGGQVGRALALLTLSFQAGEVNRGGSH